MRAGLTLTALLFGVVATALAAYLYWAHEMYGVAAEPLIKIGLVAAGGLTLAAALTAVWGYATRPRPPAD